VNRKRLIVGISILVVIVCLVIVAGIGLLLARLKKQPQVLRPRQPISELTYCNVDVLKPCVESFSVDADGNMLVNLLMPSSTYPDFYLTIDNASTPNRYECRHVTDFPTNVYCTGAEMYPGAALQFTIFALNDDRVLAEGNFAIIGLLLPSPEAEVSATPSFIPPFADTALPLESPTPFLLEILTPLPTATATASYPNPSTPTSSYPNPSYP
jgi:hypothetical protein